MPAAGSAGAKWGRGVPAAAAAAAVDEEEEEELAALYEEGEQGEDGVVVIEDEGKCAAPFIYL